MSSLGTPRIREVAIGVVSAPPPVAVHMPPPAPHYAAVPQPQVFPALPARAPTLHAGQYVWVPRLDGEWDEGRIHQFGAEDAVYVAMKAGGFVWVKGRTLRLASLRCA